MKLSPKIAITILLIAALFGVFAILSANDPQPNVSVDDSARTMVIVRETIEPGLASATFAGGCFWCTEAALQELEGVKNVISGYAGGTEFNPTYEEVYTESTSHREAVRVYFDPDVISYNQLLETFWRSIDPTDSEGQFIDRGQSYTTAIFYENSAQKDAAELSRYNLGASGRFDQPIVTPILAFTTFYEAEGYHQDFYQKSSQRYNSYTGASGRAEFKAQIWQEIQSGL